MPYLLTALDCNCSVPYLSTKKVEFILTAALSKPARESPSERESSGSSPLNLQFVWRVDGFSRRPNSDLLYERYWDVTLPRVVAQTLSSILFFKSLFPGQFQNQRLDLLHLIVVCILTYLLTYLLTKKFKRVINHANTVFHFTRRLGLGLGLYLRSSIL